MGEENDDDHLWSGEGKQTMFSSEIDVDEMYNPLYPHGQFVPKETPAESVLRRKAWISAATDNSVKFYQSIGVPHGVPGDTWVHLELKGGD
ncbi:hypothetical protein F2Q69_00038750 [Brassica cretica]|uniref:Uncharacterized protein n=1 Tax=Brassica cretica TaxID=69181 RepID=A0A8S9SHY2_BRACR|nr:hypothetical protein F2Q69_00038750 [Brassica cretica]